jgi:hypothetical protein
VNAPVHEKIARHAEKNHRSHAKEEEAVVTLFSLMVNCRFSSRNACNPFLVDHKSSSTHPIDADV